MRPAAFERFVDAARAGRMERWRFALGIVIVLVLGFLAAIIAVAAFAIYLVVAERIVPSAEDIAGQIRSTPAGVAIVLISFAGIWAGVWVAMRWLLRRPLRSLIGARGRAFWSNFGKGILAIVIAIAVSQIVTFPIDLPVTRGRASFGVWLIWLLPICVAVLIQTSAEEVFFRGYLIQFLAARARSPLVWALGPALVFILLHLSPSASLTENAMTAAWISLFAAGMILLLYRSGNLAAGMGVHFGTNVAALAFVAQEGGLNGAALFVGPSLGMLTPGQLVVTLLTGLLSTVLALVLLLHPRSPLRVTGGVEAAISAVG